MEKDIKEILEFILNNNSSIRKTAMNFNMSQTTLRRKIDASSENHAELYEKVRNLFEMKKTTIPMIYSDETVIEIADLIIETGWSLNKISRTVTNIPRKSIEDLINKRLRNIDPIKFSKVKEIIELNTYVNINDNNELLNQLAIKFAILIIKNNFSMAELCDYVLTSDSIITKKEIYNSINNHLHNQTIIIDGIRLDLHKQVQEIFKTKAYEIIDKKNVDKSY